MPPYKSGTERVKENMLDQFKDIICQYVEVKREDISEESRFVEDLGFNSYDFMSMVGELEDTYDIEVEEREIGGTYIRGITLWGYRREPMRLEGQGLYHVAGKVRERRVPLHFIPYFAWANRGENEMQVWTRESGSRDR